MPQLPVRNGKTHGWGPLSSLELLRGDLILLALARGSKSLLALGDSQGCLVRR